MAERKSRLLSEQIDQAKLDHIAARGTIAFRISPDQRTKERKADIKRFRNVFGDDVANEQEKLAKKKHEKEKK